MKACVVYYSMSSNTEYVANKIAKSIGADLVSLIPEVEYPDNGFKKYFWGGKSALMKDTPMLKKYDFDASKYEVLIFGTPVWASSYTPPLRTFIEEQASFLKNKKICAFACYSGAGAKKALEKLRLDLQIPSFAASMMLIDPKEKPSKEKENQIKEFCKSIHEFS